MNNKDGNSINVFSEIPHPYHPVQSLDNAASPEKKNDYRYSLEVPGKSPVSTHDSQMFFLANDN